MEEKKIKISLGTICACGIITILIIALIMSWVYFISNDKINKTETIKEAEYSNSKTNENTAIPTNNTIVNTEKENIISNSNNSIENNTITNEFIQKSDTFIISKVEENSNNYKLYVYMLEKDTKKLTQEQYNDILNGKSIKFRNREWILDHKDESVKQIYLKDKNNSDSIIYINIDREVGTYLSLHWPTDKGCKDYKSSQPTILTIEKDAKVGESFAKFEYDIATSEIEVLWNPITEEGTNNQSAQAKFMKAEIEEQSETITRKFLKERENQDMMECCAYSLNGKIIVIQCFSVTGP